MKDIYPDYSARKSLGPNIDVIVRRIGIDNWGLFTRRRIPAFSLVGIYTGDFKIYMEEPDNDYAVQVEETGAFKHNWISFEMQSIVPGKPRPNFRRHPLCMANEPNAGDVANCCMTTYNTYAFVLFPKDKEPARKVRIATLWTCCTIEADAELTWSYGRSDSTERGHACQLPSWKVLPPIETLLTKGLCTDPENAPYVFDGWIKDHVVSSAQEVLVNLRNASLSSATLRHSRAMYPRVCELSIACRHSKSKKQGLYIRHIEPYIPADFVFAQPSSSESLLVWLKCGFCLMCPHPKKSVPLGHADIARELAAGKYVLRSPRDVLRVSFQEDTLFDNACRKLTTTEEIELIAAVCKYTLDCENTKTKNIAEIAKAREKLDDNYSVIDAGSDAESEDKTEVSSEEGVASNARGPKRGSFLDDDSARAKIPRKDNAAAHRAGDAELKATVRRRPRGRAPTGCAWDYNRGAWVPTEEREASLVQTIWQAMQHEDVFHVAIIANMLPGRLQGLFGSRQPDNGVSVWLAKELPNAYAALSESLRPFAGFGKQLDQHLPKGYNPLTSFPIDDWDGEKFTVVNDRGASQSYQQKQVTLRQEMGKRTREVPLDTVSLRQMCGSELGYHWVKEYLNEVLQLLDRYGGLIYAELGEPSRPGMTRPVTAIGILITFN